MRSAANADGVAERVEVLRAACSAPRRDAGDLTEVRVEILLETGRVLAGLAARFDAGTELLDERVDRCRCGETRRAIGFLGAHRLPKLAEGFRAE